MICSAWNSPKSPFHLNINDCAIIIIIMHNCWEIHTWNFTELQRNPRNFFVLVIDSAVWRLFPFLASPKAIKLLNCMSGRSRAWNYRFLLSSRLCCSQNCKSIYSSTQFKNKWLLEKISQFKNFEMKLLNNRKSWQQINIKVQSNTINFLESDGSIKTPLIPIYWSIHNFIKNESKQNAKIKQYAIKLAQSFLCLNQIWVIWRNQQRKVSNQTEKSSF